MVLLHRISSPLLVAVATVFITFFSQSRSQEYYLPPTIEEQESGNVYLDSRQETTLKCVASGRPDPTYRWEWNGSPLVLDGKYQTMAGGNLVFMGTVDGQEITNIYDGIYQCFAANDYGVAMGNKVEVNVAYLGKFDAEGRTEVEVDIKNTAVLECNPPEGMPSPDIFWTYPQPSSDSLPYDARVNQDPDGRLIFANVEAKDARDYICNAQSQQIGTARFSAPIGLAVNTESTQFGIRAPVLVFTPSPSVTVLRTETLRLKCLANAFPTPEIKWERVAGDLPEGRHKFDSYGQELVISDVSFADEGMYRCTATNLGGSSNPYEVDVNVEAAPYWEIEPTNEIVAPDSTVVFECISNGVPPAEMSWYVDAVPLAEAPANPRREVSQDKKEITFTGLQEVDSAVYVCQASNTHGEILSSALLHVQVIPAKVVEGLPTESTVARGTDATLTCLVIGSPEPTVKWTFENVDIDPSNRIELGQSPNSGGILHTLVIKDVTDNDQGSYKCFVENRDADDQSQGNLKVKDPTRIVTPPKDLDVIEGASIKLECGVEHDSSLTLVVDWYKRDEEGQDVLLELTDSTRIYAQTGDPLKGALIINDATIGDSSFYTCVARTDVDQDTASMTLIVANVPEPPHGLFLGNQAGLSIDLSWLSPDPKNSPVLKYIVEYKTDYDQASDDWKQLIEFEAEVETQSGTFYTKTLSLSPWVTYRFRMKAENSVGTSQASGPTNPVTTPQGPPSLAPKELWGLGTEPSNMVISWQAFSKEDWNGEGFYYMVSWRPLGGTNFESQTLTGEEEARVEVASDLGTYQPYDIKVQAHNNEGAGPESGAIGYTGEDVPTDKPTGVAVNVLGPTEIEVTWEPVSDESVQGEHKGYMIEYTFESKAALSKTAHQNCTGKAEKCTLGNLQPHSSYDITVRVYNNKYLGPPSDAVSAETPEGVPGPVVMLLFAVDKGVRVEWKAPEAPNGILQGYTVKISKLIGTEVLADTEQSQELDKEARLHTFTGLESGEIYRVVMFASTTPGAGEETVDEVTVRPSGSSSGTFNTISGLSGEVIAVVVVCILFVIASVILIIVFKRRRKRSLFKNGPVAYQHNSPIVDPGHPNPGPSMRRTRRNQEDIAFHTIPQHNLDGDDEER